MRLVRPCREELAGLFATRTDFAWVCSPWISSGGAAMLHEVMRRASGSLRKLEVWLRISNDDAKAGLSDYRAVAGWIGGLREVVPDLDVQIWTAPHLHAKVVWTECGALVGSANLTLNGYERNVELSVRLEAHEVATQASIRDALRSPMVPVAEDEWKRFVASCGLPEVPPQPSSNGSEEKMPPSIEPAWEEFVATLLSERPPIRGIR
jgi:phosphatidylserine/phosphatidylglycerophosphate/cardiolipin synthase-like enzyme